MKEFSDEELDYFLYLQAELTYQHKHEDMDPDDLYPFGWYSTNNYRMKIEIIAEALKKEVFVWDTDLYHKAQMEHKI